MLHNYVTFLVIAVSFLAQINCDITNNLKYYETIKASDIGHKIVKRGANPSTHKFNQIKEIDFKALGKNFRLILSPAKGTQILYKFLIDG